MLRNYGIEDYEIAAALKIVIAQRLIRQLCQECRIYGPLHDEEAKWMDRIGVERPKKSWHPTGCEACSQTGFKGRLGVFEVWPLSQACEHKIASHASESELGEHLVSHHHPILLQDGLAKAAQGLTSLAELRGMGVSPQGHLLSSSQHRHM